MSSSHFYIIVWAEISRLSSLDWLGIQSLSGWRWDFFHSTHSRTALFNFTELNSSLEFSFDDDVVAMFAVVGSSLWTKHNWMRDEYEKRWRRIVGNVTWCLPIFSILISPRRELKSAYRSENLFQLFWAASRLIDRWTSSQTREEEIETLKSTISLLRNSSAKLVILELNYTWISTSLNSLRL